MDLISEKDVFSIFFFFFEEKITKIILTFHPLNFLRQDKYCRQRNVKATTNSLDS